jgi:fatty acid desaturase
VGISFSWGFRGDFRRIFAGFSWGFCVHVFVCSGYCVLFFFSYVFTRSYVHVFMTLRSCVHDCVHVFMTVF